MNGNSFHGMAGAPYKESIMSVRVRYAPSPTGLQHIGSARTALFNYFFARSQGGRFILRIEDTDRERYHDEALQDIYDTYEWLGIRWDEGPDVGGPYGPYFQSERFELYRKYAEQLVESGHAYYCYCSSERLENLRQEQEKTKGGVSGYDRHCRNLTEAQREQYRAQGITPVIRFKIPLDGATSFEDILLGTIERKNTDISPDPVLIKSDGFPTYHMANVVDDHLMEITHILRAQEWIPSGPLHVLLYRAFGWEPPKYCHLPMVMGSDGHKLSKRHGATSVREFRNAGYLPEALINYISLLGWSSADDREFYTKEEIAEIFTLERLNKAPAVFDYKKLEHFNGVYIRQKTDEELAALVLPFLQRDGLVGGTPSDDELHLVRGSIPIIRERLRFLSDAPELVRFLFREIESYNLEDVIPKKTTAVETLGYLEAAEGLLDGLAERSDEENERLFREKAEELGTKLGNLLMPVRVAITGTRVSPPLFESLRLLGTDRTKARIAKVKALLADAASRG
jgi:glutamyl-tRNA synthetase